MDGIARASVMSDTQQNDKLEDLRRPERRQIQAKKQRRKQL